MYGESDVATDDGVRLPLAVQTSGPGHIGDVGWAEPVNALIHHRRASVLVEASVGDTGRVKDVARKAVTR